MVIAPVVFFTIVHGLASVRDARSVGRVGIKALVYFEVVSTFALIIGLGVAKIFRTGEGFDIDPSQMNAAAIQGYTQRAAHDSVAAI
jgi:aerobic C4-dicarboxylate transport protein